MSLSSISQQITVYSGIFFLVVGLLGNGINIFIFSIVRNYRKIPCTFYFLMSSVYNIIYIAVTIITRLVIIGYGIDLTRTSPSWCKIRQYSINTFAFIAVYCSCLATIDQFFVTSQSASLRRLSNIKLAYKLVFLVTLFWLSHGILYFIFYDLSPITKTCINTSSVFAMYQIVYIIIFLSVIPITVMTLFGYLAYRNIHLTRVLAQEQADRQLIRMTLIEVLLVIISFAPMGILSIYGLITSGIAKDADRWAIEAFLSTICISMSYIYYSGTFYMFLITSTRFRQAIKNQIYFCLRMNQVLPSPTNTHARPIVNNRTKTQTS